MNRVEESARKSAVANKLGTVVVVHLHDIKFVDTTPIHRVANTNGRLESPKFRTVRALFVKSIGGGATGLKSTNHGNNHDHKALNPTSNSSLVTRSNLPMSQPTAAIEYDFGFIECKN
jgi:hypothetical protein